MSMYTFLHPALAQTKDEERGGGERRGGEREREGEREEREREGGN